MAFSNLGFFVTTLNEIYYLHIPLFDDKVYTKVEHAMSNLVAQIGVPELLTPRSDLNVMILFTTRLASFQGSKSFIFQSSLSSSLYLKISLVFVLMGADWYAQSTFCITAFVYRKRDVSLRQFHYRYKVSNFGNR